MNKSWTRRDVLRATHRPDGRDYEGVFPSLAGNPAVESTNATSLVSIVLGGSLTPIRLMRPRSSRCPRSDGGSPDEEVADVVSFVRSSVVNHAGGLHEHQLRGLRLMVGALAR